MGSRIRWYLFGNLIGIIMLTIGILLTNSMRQKQEFQVNKASQELKVTSEQPVSKTAQAETLQGGQSERLTQVAVFAARDIKAGTKLKYSDLRASDKLKVQSGLPLPVSLKPFIGHTTKAAIRAGQRLTCDELE